jgi:hypothetical protein
MTQGLGVDPLIGGLESVETVYPVFNLETIMGWIRMIQGNFALFSIDEHVWCGGRAWCCHYAA